MAIEIHTIGGYNEVGKNCTLLKVGDEAIIIDMGLHLENYIKYTQDEDIVGISGSALMKVGAVPDISFIENIKNNVKAIIPTHAHLDHLGAIPYISNRFNAPIIGTPFTTSVLNAILKDEEIEIKNPVKTLNANSIYKVSNNIQIEFINVTHSTPQTVMVAVHTKEGTVLYANDFKFDLFPTFGKGPDFDRLIALGKKGVKALISDSTYAGDARKMPSESVAKQMLKDVMLGTDSRDRLVVATTFSSHIARLSSIIEFGKKMNRKVCILGRSMAKYIRAAESINLVKFSKEAEILRYRNQMKNVFKKIKKDRSKYLLIVTGHQGEPKSVLSRMAKGEFELKLEPEDHLIFSCNIIPTPTNKENREKIEKRLRYMGIRLFEGIHVSGHAAREDLRDLINFTKPEYIIPAHGNKQMTSAMYDLALDMGYRHDKVYLMNNGGKLRI